MHQLQQRSTLAEACMDNLTPAQRSRTMSLIRSKDTRPELTIRRLLHARGLRFRKHARWLPGQPDLVFVSARVVVFIDGDYWHGWRFPQWRDKLAPYWKQKIEGNRRRDERNFRCLRRQGWVVLRLWEHQVECDSEQCIDRVEATVRARIFRFQNNPHLIRGHRVSKTGHALGRGRV
jgi:DNA mismatch endonuclease, patch repair protein